MTAPGTEPAPERIGGYRILERLGEGGMGVVYRATDAGGRAVALKTVRRLGEAEVLGLRREIRGLARLSHPGIVRILDDGVEEGCPWYAMELVTGTPLSRRRTASSRPGSWWTRALPAADREPAAERGAPGEAMAVEEALTVARRLCSPLGYLHGEGLVHRDLKPDNVLLRDDGTLVILDFGLVASVAEPGSREGLVVDGFSAGTAAFMSPEQLRGELVDARADLWSLGVILHLLLTGTPPFPTAAAIADPDLPAPPPSAARPELPAGVDALLARLLAKERRARFGFADQVDRALAELGARNGTHAPRPKPHVYRAALAGRSQLLQGLVRHVRAQVADGRGDLVLVGGASGAGKTRLAVEVARSLELSGIALLAGAATPAPEPLRPLAPLFERAAALCREGGAPVRAQLLGGVEALLAPLLPVELRPSGDVAGGEPASRPDVVRARVLGAVTTLVDRLARTGARGLLLVLDDLQWSDDLTLAWLEHLHATGALAVSPVVVLGTYRTEEAPDRIRALVADPRVRSLELDRLDGQAIGSIVADMLAMSAPPDELVRALVRGAEGNPLFAAELLRATVETHALVRDDAGAWRLAAAAPAFPESLLELLASRLGALDPRAEGLARAAAVLGREAPLHLLLAVSALPEAAFLDALRELERRGVLEPAGAGGFRFAHDKLAEVTAGRTPVAEAALLHRRAALRLEEEPAERRPFTALVAHWQAAGDRARARAAALPAARRARAAYDKAEAERLYRIHLEGASEPATDAERAGACDARLELARLVFTLGRTPEAALLWREALAIADALQDPRRRATAHRGLANAAPTREEADPWYLSAEALAKETGDPELLGEMMHARALHLADVGERDEAERLYEECALLAKGRGDLAGEAGALGGLAQMWNDRGERARAREAHLRLLDIYAELGDEGERGIILGNLGMGYLAEDVPRAAALLEEAAAALRRAGDARNEPSMLGYLAVARFQIGQQEEARRIFRAAVDAHGRTGNTRWHAMTLSQWIDQETRVGDPESARSLARECAAVPLEPGDIIQGFRAAALATLALVLGESAGEHLEMLDRTVEHLGLGPDSVLGELSARIRHAIDERTADRPLPPSLFGDA